MTQFVIDCSVTMAWCFPDEENAYADAALDALKIGEAYVPGLWSLEIANVLAMSERRQRLTADQSSLFLQELVQLPITIERETPDLAFTEILSLARSHRLTAYDAAYLELALRRSLPLCTFDEELKQAATTAGVPFFTA